LTFDVLNGLLRITPRWADMSRFRFHLSTCSLSYALRNFVTCWDRKSTFEENARGMKNGRPVHMARSFDLSKVLFVVGFERRLLARLGSKNFPVGSGRLGDVIVIDGNNRLTAHAVRRKLKLAPRGEKVVVGVWIGKLQEKGS